MEGIERLEAAVEVLSAVADDSPALSTGALKTAVVDLHRIETRIAAIRLRLFGAIDLRKAWADDGSRSPASWLGKACNTSPVAARRDAALARLRRQMPVTEAALRAGEIDRTHAAVLAASAGSQRKVVVAAFPEAEADLVRYARDLPFVDFVKVVKHWEDVVDQDGAERKADRDREARRLSVSPTMDGTVVIDGQLDAVEGTELMTALRRIDRELFLAEWAKVVDEHGDAAARSQLTGTSAQRRADALVEMARRAMASPQGARLPEPLVTVVVGLETLSGRVCELFNRLPVTPGQIARRLDRADVERIVFSGKRRVIDLGRRERFFKGGLRRVIEIRDRECSYAGCTVPADECQMDHIHPHGLGGETNRRTDKPDADPTTATATTRSPPSAARSTRRRAAVPGGRSRWQRHVASRGRR
jgi:hypothetical protein